MLPIFGSIFSTGAFLNELVRLFLRVIAFFGTILHWLGHAAEMQRFRRTGAADEGFNSRPGYKRLFKFFHMASNR